MRDFGASHDHQQLAASKPWKSLLAVTIGALVVVPKIVSYVHTASRVQAIEQIATGGSRPTIAVRILFVGSVVAALGSTVRGLGPGFALASLAGLAAAASITQARLNAAWQRESHHPRRGRRRARAGLRAEQ